MNTYIVSLDFLLNSISVHLILQEPFGFTTTKLVGVISSQSQLKTIRKFIETENKSGLVNFFKEMYSLTHSKITISYGPELRKWIVERNKSNKKLKGKELCK